MKKINLVAFTVSSSGSFFESKQESSTKAMDVQGKSGVMFDSKFDHNDFKVMKANNRSYSNLVGLPDSL
ncbi:MAG: hypothetical protein RBQ95_05490 [Paracholeplasma sp.]|nr:hypothetical protein [Paracholeplasma sp.]MDY3196296.1 hypothetical protein [Paracholeplasma sp.]